MKQDRHKRVEVWGFFCTFLPFLLKKGVRILLVLPVCSSPGVGQVEQTSEQNLGWSFVHWWLRFFVSLETGSYHSRIIITFGLFPNKAQSLQIIVRSSFQHHLRSGSIQRQKHYWKANWISENMLCQKEKLDNMGKHIFWWEMRWPVFLLFQVHVKPFIYLKIPTRCIQVSQTQRVTFLAT